MDPGVIVTIVLFVLMLFGPMFWFGFRQGQLSSEVSALKDQMKDIQKEFNALALGILRRGQTEAVQKGWASFSSPFHIGKVAIDKVLPFITEFMPFYVKTKQENPTITDEKFILLLEAEFGDKIIEKLCAPEMLSNFGCLVAILEVCKLQDKGGNSHATQ